MTAATAIPGHGLSSEQVGSGGSGIAEPRPADARPSVWHRIGQSGTLRAAIFGVSDGLVSNLALVMGVAGATTDGRMVVLAGLAGLLAGAFSMAAGEWISMTSQRELFERQIDLARERCRTMPGLEEAELAALYERKGIPEAEAQSLAARLMADPDAALDTKVREELGLDPGQLGSPWGAAIGSLLSFTAGAFVPLAPYLVAGGSMAIVWAVALSLLALAAVGAGVSLATGRRAVRCALRQVATGAVAATVTFAVGTVIGVQVGG
jgi:VIT1/CCC1 family predicted Fe2+/Mn2+ transporter